MLKALAASEAVDDDADESDGDDVKAAIGDCGGGGEAGKEGGRKNEDGGKTG